MAKSKRDDDREEVLAEVSGASVGITPWQGYQWSYWGSSRMMMTATRVVERTKFFISERFTTVPLNEITGVTLLTTPNPVLLALGFATLIFCGLGLIFLLMCLFMKHTYLIVTTANNVLVIGCKGNITNYEDFKHDILDEIDRLRKSTGGGSGGGGAAHAPPPASSRSVPAPASAPVERVTAAPKGGTPMVSCNECGSEYRIPAGSAGKRFKCQKCQAIISVPDEL